jgi:ferredoxin
MDCVEVCPVDCFHEGPNFLAIDLDTCIDCGACEPTCPTKAIFPADALPEPWKHYVQLNAELARRWPTLTQKGDPLPDADRWKEVKDKEALLDRG